MLDLTLALLVLAFCFWMLWRKKQLTVLRNMGIPGPEPNILFGNLWELSSKTPLECHKEWIQKYGRVVGYYLGMKPLVLIADPDLLKKIQVSDFHNFINRAQIFSPGRRKLVPGDGFSSQLTVLKDKRWKEIRSTLTPSFTASKMKTMSPIINDAVDSLIENIGEKAKRGEAFDIYKFYQGLTMDVIGRTAFGIQTDCQRNPKDPFLRSARTLFSGNIASVLNVLRFSFPELNSILRPLVILRLMLQNSGVNPVQELIDSVKKVIHTRRENPKNQRQDLLQLMMDAEVKESSDSKVTAQELTAGDESLIETNTSNGSTTKSGKHQRHMNDHDITDNAVLFFLAGYETTSTSLAFATHFLVHHPEIQERIRDELKSLLTDEEKLDYSAVQQLQYLDQFLNESLRMYPPVYLFVTREVREDVEIGGFRLKKGTAIQVPAYTLQHDEQYWPDPEKFDPDRFSSENKSLNHPFAFQAFGAGPRNCVGMRFAQMEEKLALARILLKYRLVKCEETDKPEINLRVTTATITPGKGVYLKAVPL